MKKIIALILVLVVAIPLVACGEKCDECYGKGVRICPMTVEYDRRHLPFRHLLGEDCSVCVDGFVGCEHCNGTGRIK